LYTFVEQKEIKWISAGGDISYTWVSLTNSFGLVVRKQLLSNSDFTAVNT
jgi:hypothetical protein